MLDGSAPSKYLLSQFRKSSGDVPHRADDSKPAHGKFARTSYLRTVHMRVQAPVGEVLEWLDATSFLKDVDDCKDNAKAVAKIVARCLGKPRSAVLSKMKYMSRTPLRLARVRLDCLAMALYRFWIDYAPLSFNQTMESMNPSFHQSIDPSINAIRRTIFHSAC